MGQKRIEACFSRLQADGRKALICYLMAGDPDSATSLEIARAAIKSGADIIEIGAPFTDPMADGPSIQRAALRALANNTRLEDVLGLIKQLREEFPDTPLILMGYVNPIHKMGYDNFAKAAAQSGMDGSIIVDLPPEEDAALRDAYGAHDLSVIRLATPTTDEARMRRLADGASGFLYFVSVAGVTGGLSADSGQIEPSIKLAQRISGLPVCIGFGIRNGDQAKEMANISDGVVVGSAFVDLIAKAADAATPKKAIETVSKLVKELADSVHGN